MNTIYALVDPRSGEVRYIGKASNPKRRLANHLAPANLKRPRHVSCWLKGLKDAGLGPVLVCLEEVPADADWQEAERRWIAHYRSLGCDLCNLTDGGEGGATHFGHDHYHAWVEAGRLASARKKGKPGRKATAEERERIRRSAKERWAKGEGIGRKGHPVSEETKEKMRAAKKGKPLTPEHREKLRLAKLGKKQPAEMIEKRTAKLRGRTFTPDQRTNMAAAQRERRQREKERLVDAENQ